MAFASNHPYTLALNVSRNLQLSASSDLLTHDWLDAPSFASARTVLWGSNPRPSDYEGPRENSGKALGDRELEYIFKTCSRHPAHRS